MARERLAAGDLFRLTSLLGSRINHLANFGAFRGWKSTDLRMLLDNGFILGEINAEGLALWGWAEDLFSDHFPGGSDW